MGFPKKGTEGPLVLTLETYTAPPGSRKPSRLLGIETRNRGKKKRCVSKGTSKRDERKKEGGNALNQERGVFRKARGNHGWGGKSKNGPRACPAKKRRNGFSGGGPLPRTHKNIEKKEKHFRQKR